MGDAGATAHDMASKYMPEHTGFSEEYADWTDEKAYTTLSQWNVENGKQQGYHVALEQLPQIQLPNITPFYIAFSDGIRQSGVYKFAGFEPNTAFLQDFIAKALHEGKFSNDDVCGDCIFAIYTVDYSFYDKNMNSVQASTKLAKELVNLVRSNIKSESFLGE